jgi:hypothetical protein
MDYMTAQSLIWFRKYLTKTEFQEELSAGAAEEAVEKAFSLGWSPVPGHHLGSRSTMGIFARRISRGRFCTLGPVTGFPAGQWGTFRSAKFFPASLTLDEYTPELRVGVAFNLAAMRAFEKHGSVVASLCGCNSRMSDTHLHIISVLVFGQQ